MLIVYEERRRAAHGFVVAAVFWPKRGSDKVELLGQFRLQCRQFEVLGSGFYVQCCVQGSRFLRPVAANAEPRTSNRTQNQAEPRTPPHRNEKRISASSCT